MDRFRSTCAQPFRWPALAAVLLATGSLTVGLLPAEAQEKPAKTYGSAFLDAHFEPGKEVRDAVRLRYKCQVAENTCTPQANQQVWKIIFMFHALAGEPKALPRGFQSNLYSWRFVYPHLLKLTQNRGDGRRDIQGETSLFLSVPDDHKDKRMGARTRDPVMFPTMDQEIDGFKDLWKREQVSQANLTGKVLTIDIARGEIAADLKDWCVHGALPADKYRVWTMTAAWDGKSYAVDIVLPDAGAKYFRPAAPTQIATEAFYIHPGRMRAYYWDLELQRENRTDWEPIRTWRLMNTDAKPDENTWGMKRATVRGRLAIEVSNDGTKTYLKKGESLELK